MSNCKQLLLLDSKLFFFLFILVLYFSSNAIETKPRGCSFNHLSNKFNFKISLISGQAEVNNDLILFLLVL